MNNLIITNIDSMTSLEVAELTGKNHADVLRDTRNMLTELFEESAASSTALAAISSTYTDVQNQERPMYKLNKELTLTLTSGYSVKQRNIIIKRWLELEGGPKSATELIIANAMQLLKVEQEQARQAQQLTEIQERLENMDGNTGYQTILAWCRTNDVKLSLKDSNRLGRKCSSYCKKAEITMGSIPDERWGSVKSYPMEVIDEVFRKF